MRHFEIAAAYSGTQIWDNDLSCWFAATILAEYNSNGNPIQETVYLDDKPVVALKQEHANMLIY
jgi:hypothetical protein